MDTKSRNELRLLKAYALTITVLLTVPSLAAFTRFGQKPRFEERLRNESFTSARRSLSAVR